MRAALAMDAAALPFVFGPDERTRLAAVVDIDFDRTELDAKRDRDVELLITGWGVPSLTDDILDGMSALKAVVHWGGGVGFLPASASARGIRVSSARPANAIPVAEFTIAMITLAAKDVFWASRQYATEQRFIDREAELPDTGLFGTTVGIVGASSIGTLVIERLAAFDVEVLIYDPTVSAESARRLGATRVDDVVALASRSRIVSIHAPEQPQTRGMVSREMLAAMPDGATIINTARGSLIDQEALVDELSTGRLRAVLDVTEPDVLPTGHPLYTLPNAFLTPHLAGSTGRELRRLGRAAVDEVERWAQGCPFAHSFVL